MQRNQVETIAHLARLSLTEEEQVRFGAQLTDILAYFEKLQELSTPADPSHATPAEPRTRADRPESWEPRDRLLDQCPEVLDGCMVVPRILE